MFRLYRQLEHGEKIVIGGDPSEGGNDYSAAQCYSLKHRDFPMVMHGRMEATQFGHELYKLAIYIKKVTGEWPLIAIERSMGLGAIYVLQEYNYPNLFRMPTLGDAIENEEDNKIGWVTNKTTRMLAIDGLAIALRQKAVRIYDIQTVKELMTFIIGYNGKPQAANGAYDDLVMSAAIALKVAEISPKTRTTTKEEMIAKMAQFPQIQRDPFTDTPE